MCSAIKQAQAATSGIDGLFKNLQRLAVALGDQRRAPLSAQRACGSKLFHQRPGHVAFHVALRSEEHTSELQSRGHLVCRLLREKENHTGRRYLSTPLTQLVATVTPGAL